MQKEMIENLEAYGALIDAMASAAAVEYYFVVMKSNGVIVNVVQRSSKPQDTATYRFVKATGVTMQFYYWLLEEQDVVTIDDVLNYGNPTV